MRGTTMTLVVAMMTVAASAAAQESGATPAPSAPVVTEPRAADVHWPEDLPIHAPSRDVHSSGERAMRSPTMLAFGVGFCVAGFGGSIASFVAAGSVDKSGPMGGLNALPYMGLGMLSLAVGSGIGIPLIVVGAKREPTTTALARTRLDVGLGTVGASWAF